MGSLTTERNLASSGISFPNGADPFRAPSAAAVETERKIALTIGYMKGSLNQPLQVPTLARLANISLSHFFAVFKKRTGLAPKDFFIRLRIQRACEILEATDLCVKEVAAELGYDDAFYF